MSNRTYRPGFWPGRSNVLARQGMVCSSQPLATQAGIAILREGGNAIDAAIATAATLCVVEPMSTGLGGDHFSLHWSARDSKLKALNGSGRSPAQLSWRLFARSGLQQIPQRGWQSVTVPGVVDGWWQLHRADGQLPWKRLFEAAIHYAAEGFPLSEIVVDHFKGAGRVLKNDEARTIYLPNGLEPQYGQIFKQPDLAQTFSTLAKAGRDGFYRGEIAEELLKVSKAEGGYFSKEDLSAHRSDWVEPLSTEFMGLQICQLPPNGQGLAVLIGLNILKQLELDRYAEDWVRTTHLVIEAVKLAYAERNAHIADPATYRAPLGELLSDDFAQKAAQTIDLDRALPRSSSLIGSREGDTVYLCTADGAGNLVSLINSLYLGFGSGVVAGRTGILLQSRGAGFSLDPLHPNLLESRKRPFHTLVPGFALREGMPHLAMGVMGAHHQAQGQLQFLINLLHHKMGLQESLTAPRFDFRDENYVAFEVDVPEVLQSQLAVMGHRIVEKDTGPFGGGQVIRKLAGDCWEGASDSRKDGMASGF